MNLDNVTNKKMIERCVCVLYKSLNRDKVVKNAMNSMALFSH